MAVGPEYGGFDEIPMTAMSAGQVATAASRMFLILMICAFSLPGLAQSTAGRILGSISDQSGAAVTGATVVVTDVDRGTSRTLTTDQAGAYVAADLTPGTYKIHVEAKGFKSLSGRMSSSKSRLTSVLISLCSPGK